MKHQIELPGLLLRSAVACTLTLQVVGCMPVGPAISVTPREGTAVWGGAGLDLGTAGFGGQLELTRMRDNRLLRTRLSGHSNMGESYGGKPPRDVAEWSILMGRGRPCCGQNWGGWAIGPSYVTGSLGWAPAEEIRTIGVTAEAFMISGRFPHLSVGVFGNANPSYSFAGISVGLALGQMPFRTTGGPWIPRRPVGPARVFGR
jgi:hypothetical protein